MESCHLRVIILRDRAEIFRESVDVRRGGVIHEEPARGGANYTVKAIWNNSSYTHVHRISRSNDLCIVIYRNRIEIRRTSN